MKTYKIENYIQGSLSFHMFQEEVSSRTIPLHTHEFAEIIYVTHGECIQTINGVSYPAKRGDIIFINRGISHSFSTVNSFTYYNICFSPEIVAQRIIDRQNAFDLLSLSTLEELQSEAMPIGKFSFDANERMWIEQLLQDMHFEYTSNHSNRSAILESYMTILIAKLFRKTHLTLSKEHVEFTGVWQALSEFIDENLNQKLSLEELAQKCFYNPSYFSRVFKTKFGISPLEYITRERVNMAAKYLADNALSIEKITELCGFGDSSSLYRAFEKYLGCSPSEYRKTLFKS